MPENPTREEIKERIIEVMKTIYDPEIPVNIYELGLIYDIHIDDEYRVHIKMTLTAPGCPVAGMLVQQVENGVRSVQGVKDVKVDLVWDPPWSPEMMSDAAKMELGYL